MSIFTCKYECGLVGAYPLLIMANGVVSSGYVVVGEVLKSTLEYDGQTYAAGAAELGNNVTNLTPCL